jgi:hypothetical protein
VGLLLKKCLVTPRSLLDFIEKNISVKEFYITPPFPLFIRISPLPLRKWAYIKNNLFRSRLAGHNQIISILSLPRTPHEQYEEINQPAEQLLTYTQMVQVP